MKVEEIPAGRRGSLVLQSPDPLPDWLKKGDEVWLTAEGLGFVLHSRDGAMEVKGRAADDRRELRQITEAGESSVAWIRAVTRNARGENAPSVFLTTLAFPSDKRFGDELLLELGDLNVTDLQRLTGISPDNTERIIDWVGEEFLLPIHPSELKADLEKEHPRVESTEDVPVGPTEDTDSTLGRLRLLVSAGTRSGADEAFTIHGRSVSADVRRVEGGAWTITRFAKRGPAHAAVFVISAPVQIVDRTTAAQIRDSHRQELLGHLDLEGTRAFLTLWDEYQRLEREQVMARAARLGSVEYTSVRRAHHGGWQFMLKAGGGSFIAKVQSGEPLAATMEPPNFRVDEHFAPHGTFIARTYRVLPDPDRIDLADPGNQTEPPPRGYLAASLASDLRRLQRRDRARRMLSETTGPMPQLGFLIEGIPTRTREVRRERPLSSTARRTLGGSPTPRQVDALDVALNTPDVAIIQGPPGTGKSTVIAALTARLAEVSDDSALFGRATLLSSFQHDAVEHVVSKTQVLGMPGLKIGQRFGSGEGDRLPAFEAWKREVVTGIRAASEGGVLIHKVNSARLLRQKALLPLENGERATILRRAGQLTTGRLAVLLEQAAEGLDQVHDAPPEPWLGHLHRWTSLVGDSSLSREERLEAAFGAVSLIERHRGERPSSLSELAAWVRPEEPPASLFTDAGLECLAYLPNDVERSSGVREPPLPEQVALLDRLVAELQTEMEKSVEAPALVALQFAERLENDPDGAEAFARQYSAVLAATCQQAASGEMADMKDGNPVFESVIIDEAARANPLDLMIPMSMGRSRVILVGDHRQLPQMLEPDVEREVRHSIGDEHAERLRQSLFERLFQQLKDLEQDTGVTRVVTLDTQFRMHPRLAEYVSGTYYRADGGLLSHPSTHDLGHQIPGMLGRVAVWVDVPMTSGSERKVGTGWSRLAEAAQVATTVESLTEVAPDLSVGVITFYAAQRDRICEELAKRGLMYRNDDGAWISQRPAVDDHVAEPLRVGTVDAFQGTEFDVVVLSIVRSNNRACAAAEEQRRKWGFLTLPNRMCVATSRQRRLLVVVGDAQMAEGAAVEWAPELAALRSLCINEERHGA